MVRMTEMCAVCDQIGAHPDWLRGKLTAELYTLFITGVATRFVSGHSPIYMIQWSLVSRAIEASCSDRK